MSTNETQPLYKSYHTKMYQNYFPPGIAVFGWKWGFPGLFVSHVYGPRSKEIEMKFYWITEFRGLNQEGTLIRPSVSQCFLRRLASFHFIPFSLTCLYASVAALRICSSSLSLSLSYFSYKRQRNLADHKLVCLQSILGTIRTYRESPVSHST